MTISKGSPWGVRGALPPGTVDVVDDRAGREVVERARHGGGPIPPLRVDTGDLCRTLGHPSQPKPAVGDEVLLFPADAGIAVLDGVERCFIAHLVARRSWWRGRVVAVMNAQFLGTWDVAPRSHPNDGRVDVLDVAASFTVRDRWRARKRLATGTHVPHPSISVRQVSTWSAAFDEPMPIRLDGELVGTARELHVRVEPDALLLVL